MNNLLTIILFVLIATLIGSFGALLLKKGSSRLRIVLTFNGMMAILTNYFLLLGILLYGLSVIFFIIALKIGDLSVVYPMTSMSYIFVTILSAIFLKERINRYKIFGVGLIVLGVILVTL